MWLARADRGPGQADRWNATAHFHELITQLHAAGHWPTETQAGRSVASPSRAKTRGLARRWPSSPSSAALAAGAVAASVVAFAALIVGIVRPSQQPRHDPHDTAVYTARAGQRTTIALADGGRVMLAPGSTLRLSGRDGGAFTNAELVGEAFFDVTSHPNAPVIVRTGAVQTRVLGTRFTVRRYPSDEETQVAVESGKVEVRGTGLQSRLSQAPAVVLSAGMVGRATDSTASGAVTDIRPLTSWVNGSLVFRDAPVPEVLAELGRWYGFTFKLGDSTLVHRHLSATFDYKTTEEMFSALKILLDVRVAFDTGAVTLYPRGGAAGHPALPLRIPTHSEVGR